MFKKENSITLFLIKYFLIVFFFLIFCAYVGQSVDNLLLTFLAGNFLNNLKVYLSLKFKILIFSFSLNSYTRCSTPQNRAKNLEQNKDYNRNWKKQTNCKRNKLKIRWQFSVFNWSIVDFLWIQQEQIEIFQATIRNTQNNRFLKFFSLFFQ